jgi:tetratricopeptide (TPR) repeat protein
VSSPLIEQGLAALRDGEAATARRVFEFALTEGESGEVLEGLAEALYLEREYVASAAHYERAFSVYRRERQSMAAGRAARTAAWITGNVLGDWAVRSGWLARARTILEQAGEDRPEHGWVLIIRAFSEPDAQVREALLREAIAVGRRFGDPDIEFLAMAYLGGLLVMTDRVEEGLVLSDEALAAACAGELTELATVDEVFCGLFWACELVNDVPRADQWMRAAAERMQRSNVVAAFCRAHYGGILTAAGRWQEAETELVQAVRHFDRGLSGRRPLRSFAWRTCVSGRAAWRRPPSFYRDSSSTRTPSGRWPPCTWPGVTRHWRGSCSSGPPRVWTVRSPQSASRAWWVRCSRSWSTSTSSRETSTLQSRSPGA